VLRPTVGELLDGVRTQLAAQVLPSLPAGAEARQLRAALHVLGVLATTWDRQRTVLEADNADLDSSIEAFCARGSTRWRRCSNGGGASPGRTPGPTSSCWSCTSG
jgi:hypothetical protein